MAPVGRTIPSRSLHFLLLCCAPLIRAHLHIVTPLSTPTSTPTSTTTTPSPTTTAPDTFLIAYHHAQRLRAAPALRNDLNDPPDDTYDTLTRSSHVASYYPPLTHDFPSVSPPPPPSALHSLPTHAPLWPPPHALPPAPPCHPTPYASPSPLLPFLPAKLSLKLLLKILLKVALFKMVVKLIAVVCLLLFIPVLKAKGSGAGGEAEEQEGRAERLAAMSEAIWDSLDEKKWMYGDDEEMQELREIAEEDEEEEKENALTGPTNAVNFLKFCVSAVDRVVGYLLGVLQKQRNEREDLASFFLEELTNLVKNL